MEQAHNLYLIRHKIIDAVRHERSIHGLRQKMARLASEIEKCAEGASMQEDPSLLTRDTLRPGPNLIVESS